MFQEYENHDGLGLAELVRDGEVQAKDLVDCAVKRIEARNPRLNAVVHKMYDQALAACRQPLEGPFAGVPFLVKDLLAAVAGEPLTASCAFLDGFLPGYDSELVSRYRQCGLLLVGKTNAPEFGVMPVTEPAFRGATLNPWNPNHTPGGSSGGAAAAVTAGLVPLAHGNDGGGSIRIPASCCGLFGLKPTRGRNPLDVSLCEGWGGFVQDHVLTRSVRDSAAALDATHGPDSGAPFHVPWPERPYLDELAREPGPLRIAFSSKSLFGNSTHPDCVAAVEDAAKLCASLGHQVEEASPEIDKAYLIRSYLLMIAVDVAQAIEAAGQAMGRTPTADGFEPQTWTLGLIGRKASATDYAEAIEATRMAARGLAGFFESCDLFLTPTLAHPPVSLGYFDLTAPESIQLAVLRRYPVKALLDKALDELSKDVFESTANTMLFNMTGQPAMSVPLYWSGAGLPIGVQFAARFGDEARLFALAGQLERARPWFHKRPPKRG